MANNNLIKSNGHIDENIGDTKCPITVGKAGAWELYEAFLTSYIAL